MLSFGKNKKYTYAREHFRANSFIGIYELKTGLRIVATYKRPLFFFTFAQHPPPQCRPFELNFRVDVSAVIRRCKRERRRWWRERHDTIAFRFNRLYNRRVTPYETCGRHSITANAPNGYAAHDNWRNEIVIIIG